MIAPPPAIAAPSVTDEAARAWSVTQNTTSIAVMEDFIRQFGGTAYGSMARARLQEMKKSQSAAVTPSAVTPRQVERNRGSFVSGQYDVVASGFTSTFTDRKSTRLNSSHSGEHRMPSSA